jgi:hypothetical protein
MKSKKEVAEIRRERDEAVGPLVAGGEELVRRLAHLKEDDKATIVALMMVTEALGSYAWSVGRSNRRILDPFLQKLADLSPPFAGHVNFPGLQYACVDAVIDYKDCRAKCEEDGVSEEECDSRCWREERDAAMCVIGQGEGVRIKIPDIIPDPFPPPSPPPPPMN